MRKYLVEKHAIQSAGWFKSRKVAAVGFGSHVAAHARCGAFRLTRSGTWRSSCSRPRRRDHGCLVARAHITFDQMRRRGKPEAAQPERFDAPHGLNEQAVEPAICVHGRRPRVGAGTRA